jgi:hypothetical protein
MDVCGQGCQSIAYPPRGPDQAARDIFLSGGTDDEAYNAKLALLLYYLFDAGLVTSTAGFR